MAEKCPWRIKHPHFCRISCRRRLSRLARASGWQPDPRHIILIKRSGAS